MGLFDHLFKSKSPPSEENSVETGAKPAEPAKQPDDAARGTPPQRADPSAFLHPKSFVPRGVSPLTVPAKSGAISGVRKPGGPPAPPAAEEIVLTLGDVLSRIPTPYLKSGQHDPKREIRFNINDLSSDIARGRAAVPLSRIARLVPDIFVKEISRDEDTEVRLPLQKLVEQIGLLRSRPHGVSSDRVGRPIAGAAVPSLPASPAKVQFPGPVIEVAETARDTLRDLFPSMDPVFELKPFVEQLAAAVPAVSASPVLAEAPTTAASLFEPAPVPALAEPIVTPSEVIAPAAPLEQEITVSISALTEAPMPAPVVENTAPVIEPPALPFAEVSAVRPAEPVPPARQTADPVAALIPEPIEQEAPEFMEAGSEKIHLSLAAILRQCPPEIIVGDLPVVPDNVRITLPFAPIDRQLVMGHVEVSAVRFVAALPFSYQQYFSARIGVKVPIPLEEVFQNLPGSVTEPPLSGPAPQILAPSAPEAVPPPPVEMATPVHPAPTPVSEPISVVENPPVAVTPAAPVAVAATSETPAETVPAPAPPPLDLPAFLQFSPPPLILPDDFKPVETATGLAPETLTKDPTPALSLSPLEAGGGGPAPALSLDNEGAVLAESVAPVAELPPLPSLPIPPVVESPVASTSELPREPEAPVVDRSVESEIQKPSPATTEPPAAAPVESNSPAVFAEANQIIPPPQLFRPFIVLPPPIFGFTPDSSSDFEDKSNNQTSNDEVDANGITHERENKDAIIPAAEIPFQVLPSGSSEPPGESAVPVEAKVVDVDPPEHHDIISIDFSQALVPPDESPVEREVPAVEVADIPPPVLGEPSSGDILAAESPASQEPLVAGSEPVESKVSEEIPALVREEVPIIPAVERPVEAPREGITFVVEGHFVEPLAPPVVPPPAVEEEQASAASSEPEVISSEVAKGDDFTPMPLLPLPRFVPEDGQTDVLPPPALPLRRFDQDALQALFMTEEVLDLARISRLAAQLPGVHACVIATRDQACTGGTLPDGFDLAALLGLAPRVGEAAGRMPIGGLKHFTLYGEHYSVSFFARNGLSLCAVHRPRSFVPGVREKLVAIADELSK